MRNNGDAEPEDVVVSGLAITKDMLQSADMTLEALAFDQTTAAYRIYSLSQYKIYFDAALAGQRRVQLYRVYSRGVGWW